MSQASLPPVALIRPLTAATEEVTTKLCPRSHDRIRLELDGVTRFLLTFVDGRYDEPRRSLTREDSELLDRLPETRNAIGKKQLPPGQWYVAATDFTATIIAHSWPLAQLDMDDEAATVFAYLLQTLSRHDEIAKLYARFKEDGTIPDEARALEYDMSQPPTDYQLLAAYCATRSEGYALFKEQGTGKTYTAILAMLNKLRRRGPSSTPFRTLIVCPSNVRMNWQKELFKFSTRVGRVEVLRGDALRRVDILMDAMRCDPDDEFAAVVCSYDVLVQSWNALSEIPWDLSILDESHYIKTPSTRRNEYAQKLRDVSASRMILTGTPITNTPLDLFSQLEFLYRGGSGFINWKNFRTFFGRFERGANGFETLVGLQNIPIIQERLARLSFNIRKAEALPDLPPKVYDVVEVEMTARQAEVYKQVAQDIAAECDEMLEDEEHPRQLIVSNILAKLRRLAEITSGYVVWDAVVNEETGEVIKPRRVEPFEPVPKIEWLIEELQKRDPLSKTIVWACWKQDHAAIGKRLAEVGIDYVSYTGGTNEADRAEAEERFNCDPDCTVLLGSQAAGGTGLNLLGYPPGDLTVPTNCDWQVYYSQNWSPTQRSQSEDRPNRRGTRVPTRTTDLCVPGTIDEEIRARVVEKIKTALEVSDVRKILRAVLSGRFDG